MALHRAELGQQRVALAVVLLALVVLIALIWGRTHPPAPLLSPPEAYLISISPFDPHHYKALSR